MTTFDQNSVDKMIEEVKGIIYKYAKKGSMCEELEDGQIIGIRTGKGLELDLIALGIAGWHVDKIVKTLTQQMDELIAMMQK